MNNDKGYYEVIHVSDSDGIDNRVTLFSEREGSILYIGNGNLQIRDYRGEFWQDDYTESRKGLKIQSFREVGLYTLIDFEDNYALELDCNTEKARLRGATDKIDRWWLRHVFATLFETFSDCC